MKIYVRTEEGQVAAYSPQSALPRKLKSILKVVDGKTRSQVFRENLHSFGDVDGLLLSLELAGLLRQVPESVAEERAEHESPLPVYTRQMQERDWSATRHPLDTTSVPTPLTASASSFQPAPFSTTNGKLGTSGPGFASSAQNSSGDKILQAVLNEMADFVLMHSPDQSFQILKEIEEITSLEVLAATLGGYEQMVSNLGKAGADHLNSIKSTLREHL